MDDRPTLPRSIHGDVRFIDTRGHRVTLRGLDGNRLFETIRDGSGEVQEVVRKDGWQAPKNVVVNGKNNADADNVRSCHPAGTPPEAITTSKQSR